MNTKENGLHMTHRFDIFHNSFSLVYSYYIIIIFMFELQHCERFQLLIVKFRS